MSCTSFVAVEKRGNVVIRQGTCFSNAWTGNPFAQTAAKGDMLDLALGIFNTSSGLAKHPLTANGLLKWIKSRKRVRNIWAWKFFGGSFYCIFQLREVLCETYNELRQ